MKQNQLFRKLLLFICVWVNVQISLPLFAAGPSGTNTVLQQEKGTTFVLKGVLLDSLTNEGEPYATVKVTKKENPNEAVKMFVTNGNGGFEEKISGSGNFTITFSSVGRQSVVKDFSVKAGTQNATVDLGTLYITDATNELGEVQVVAQKTLVKIDLEKIEYNIQDDPDSKTNSVLEMLRKVPMVTVDGEDNIQVNGSSSFKVYVNGRPNNMMSNNPKEVLKSIPANTIKHIEVITNPGAKYDAEGVGGILNIVTIGSGFEGYTATISGNASNRGAGGSLYGTIQQGKFTMSARYNYNYNNSPRYYSGSSRTTVGEITESSSDVSYESNSKGDGSFQSGSLEASYEFDTLRLVSVSFGLYGGNNDNNGYSTSLATSPLNGNPIYRYIQNSNGNSSWYSIDGGIDYQRLFSVKQRMLTFSYRVSTRPNKSDSYSTYDEIEAIPEWEDFTSRMFDLYNKGSQNTTEHTFQADYTTPIGKMHTIEAGLKYILRNNSSENDRNQREAGTENDYVFDEEHSSHYRHLNNIFAAYAGYSINVKKFSGRVGLRYEHTLQDVEYCLGRGEDFVKNFDDVLPSATIGYKLTDLSNIRFGYSMRIYRPGIWYLNPYLDDSNPTSISQGNSELDSEKSHSLNLNYSNFTQKFNFNLSVGYSFANNRIESVSTLINDTEIPGLRNPSGKEVLYTTYQNIGKNKNVTMSCYINWNATSRTRIYTNLFGSYSNMEGANGLKNDGWSLFAFGGAQQTFPHDWRISVNVYGQTPWIMLQGEGNSFFDYSFNVSKSFMKNRLTISAFASNIFKKYYRMESSMEDLNFNQESWSKNSRQRFGLSISFRIGELKASVKKAARTINNDDVRESSSNSQQ